MMKYKVFNLFMIIGALLLTVSCGPSVKVTDTWKSPDISDTESDHYLVMARMDDLAGRQRFEQEISNRLREAGIDAAESYIKYPDLNLNMKMDPAQIDELQARFAKDGINGIILTVVKDMKTEINTTTSGGYHSGYYHGFRGYYGSYYSPYGYGGAYVPASSRTYESEIYKLETVIFDLNRTGDQMIAVISVNITDPKSATQVAPKYSEQLAKQFKDDRK